MRNEAIAVGAVDIGGTKIAVGIVDTSGKILGLRDTPSGAQCAYSAGISRIVEMLRALMTETGVKVGGVGIGSTGPVNPITGEFGDVDFLPLWRRTNPVRDLVEALKVRVALENDADAGALGEAAWGAGKGKKRLVYVSVGTGIGGAIVTDGKLYRGVNGAHPEIGHHVIEADGPECSCGLRGCWEALASGSAMAEGFQREASQGGNGGHVRWIAADICEAARRDDEPAKRAVEREANYLGLGIANLINIFAPDGIVLAGSVMKSADLFLPTIHSTIQKGCRFVPAQQCEIMQASLGSNANLIGAAQVWFHRFATQ